jgi:UDP-3-O-[3-hydroxymyristoyl] glucosamine N-acyltransferase
MTDRSDGAHPERARQETQDTCAGDKAVPQRPAGAFFRRPLDVHEVMDALCAMRGSAPEDDDPEPLALEGVSDSRNGGERLLLFCTAKSGPTCADIRHSLVLTDALPEAHATDTNRYCIVPDPRAAYIDALSWAISAVGIDPFRPGFTKNATISDDAVIAPSAVIEPGVEVGPGTVIEAGAVVKSGTRIGACTTIRENTVIGTDGINIYRALDGRALRFPHVGGVCIGDRTEIGAHTVVAGGMLSPTVIGDDVIIGNLCNIGHGVLVGNGVWMSVGCLVGGHASLSGGATLAMGVRVRDNLCIGENASLGMGSVIVKDVGSGHSMFGNPAKRMVGLRTGPKR